MSTVRDRRQFNAHAYQHRPLVEAPPPRVDEFDALEVPHQRHIPDYPYRGRLIAEAQRVRAMRNREGITKEQAAKADACAAKLQVAIKAVNMRLWGNQDGPSDGVVPPPHAAVVQKKGFSRAFFEVSCRRLPADQVDALKQKAEADTSSLGFLRRFESAVRSSVDQNIVQQLRTEALKEAELS